MSQSEAITAITKLPIPYGMKGLESIEQLMEHLADVIVLQEDVIRTAIDAGEVVNWVRLHTQLQTLVWQAIGRADWAMTEITGNFHSSFRGALLFGDRQEAPATVEEVR
ncbi:hypothetical protein UFOVP1008_26 [uncultured Caudovirales phage]|uniref:Uncharacterized protein n=1 Tax=uncultured Caudovirales phage TaxID=2100421 RepID=A0A6J5Q7Z0_9CAUD|nr:hypothetical protein UFOVP498_34 [uncultured Caudovirales phage]CAB4177651.1 hypothetical protein UFOVP1008_26 [uncultured Caudovirales phage]CAB4187218.1 hypothetical protein UFOVP1160_20 [uncultured Caudovirales phage]CAB4200066.1 hypothetical protein UFOVP1352_30 [uncultured Caudovirales phage]